MNETKKRIHILWSAEKDFMSWFDIPEGQDLELTIEKVAIEKIDTHTRGIEYKKVVHFQEPKIKPLICNQTNSEALFRATKKEYLDEFGGDKVFLYRGQARNPKTGEANAPCVRIRANIDPSLGINKTK